MEMKTCTGGKLLRCGYTTGSCAAGAAKAAALMLLTSQEVRQVQLLTPKGILLTLDIRDITIGKNSVRCAVQKDSGDDPDVTNGMLVYAEVKKQSSGILITGGEGVGVVTKPGLDQMKGNAAINSTPRKMIEKVLQEVSKNCSYTGGFSIVLSIPGGEERAKRTFNPRIGIVGGLSIIGTTGIVEPMSMKALTETIRVELHQLSTMGVHNVLFTPGNYGEIFAKEKLGLSLTHHVSCSNFIGDALDMAVEEGFLNILLVGHIGKLVKLGIGITNTHSAFGDGRMETLMSCALQAGGGLPLLKDIQNCISTDAALTLLDENHLLKDTMEILGKKIENTIARRIPEGIDAGYICYTNAEPYAGILTESENAKKLQKYFF